MNLEAAIPSHAWTRRARLTLWLVLAMLVQTVSMTYHATAIATGIEICTTDGARRVGTDGKRIGLDNAGPDCCCIATVGTPPTFENLTPLRASHGAPAELITTGRLSAQWLAPLSRGPPSLA